MKPIKPGNDLKDIVDKLRDYKRKNGVYPKGSFTLTKNKALLKSKGGKITIN